MILEIFQNLKVKIPSVEARFEFYDNEADLRLISVGLAGVMVGIQWGSLKVVFHDSNTHSVARRPTYGPNEENVVTEEIIRLTHELARADSRTNNIV